MDDKRFVIWVSAFAVGVAVLGLDMVGALPDWLMAGPVFLGVAGVALLADQILCEPDRRWGFIAALLMIGLSAGTVTQDAELVVDAWSIWPFVAAALVIGIPLELYAGHRRHGPGAGAHA